MELAEYIRLVRKWLWLLILMALIGGGTNFILNSGRPLLYSASATVSIGRYIDASNPNYADIQTGITLARTYAQLVRTRDVLQGTVEALNLGFSPEGLNSLLRTSILDGTSLLVLTVRYTDPILAADIANTIAEQLIRRSPSNLTSGQQAQIDYATTQIEALDQQLREQRSNLELVNTQLANATDLEEITRLTDLRISLSQQVTQAAAAIAQFQSTISAIELRTNALDLVERAAIPNSPEGSNITSAVILGAMIGATLGGGIALVIEYLDDRIKTTEIATHTLELPVLGAVPSFGGKSKSYADHLISSTDSMSPIAEYYRRLHTNLTFATTDDHSRGRTKLLVVTSPGPAEGKSVTTANLALTMARDGLRVLLIDADLRRPTQHQIFELGNEIGLSTLLVAESTSKTDANQDRQVSLKDLSQCIQITSHPNLRVITSGFVPANPAELLRSSLLARWMDAFSSAKDIDVVIIDTPPVLLFGDSTIIATVSDASMVLVIDSRKTRTRAAIETKEQLSQVGIHIKGVILNRINPRDEVGLYGYAYDYGRYYYATPENNGTGRRRFLRFLQ